MQPNAYENKDYDDAVDDDDDDDGGYSYSSDGKGKYNKGRDWAGTYYQEPCQQPLNPFSY